MVNISDGLARAMEFQLGLTRAMDFTNACTCNIWGDGMHSPDSMNPDCPCVLHRRHSLTEEADRPRRRSFPLAVVHRLASPRHPRSATAASRRSSRPAGHGALPRHHRTRNPNPNQPLPCLNSREGGAREGGRRPTSSPAVYYCPPKLDEHESEEKLGRREGAVVAGRKEYG